MEPSTALAILAAAAAMIVAAAAANGVDRDMLRYIADLLTDLVAQDAQTT